MSFPGSHDETYGRCAALATLSPRELTLQIIERVFVLAFRVGVSPSEVCESLAESTAESVPDRETWQAMRADFADRMAS